MDAQPRNGACISKPTELVYVFILIVIAITGLIHWFLYARLVSALDITSPAAIWSATASGRMAIRRVVVRGRVTRRIYSPAGAMALRGSQPSSLPAP